MARRTSVIQVMITGDSRDLQKATRGGASAFDFLGAAAIGAAKIVASAVSGIAAFSVREFSKFDAAMVQSTAIMGDLSETMRKDMSDAAREVAKTTTFTASQSAEAFFFLASAGLSAEQSIAALPKVAAFAQAGAFDLAMATDLLTDAQSALGMTSADTAEHLAEMVRISDVLVGANTLANASVEQFSAALTNKAGAALRIMNKEVEEGVAALALLADRGVKGTEAGEKLSIMLRDVTRAAARSPEEFAALGLSVLDADGNLRNIADVTEEFTRVLGGMSDAQAATTLESLGLTRSVGDVIRTMFGGADQIRTYEAALREMGGTSDDVANKQLASFSNQIALTRSAFADIGITIGEQLAGPLGMFNKWLRDQAPAVEAFVTSAIPQVTAFVERSSAKFKEFKQFYEDNIAEPLGNLMERLGTLAGKGLEFAKEFKDRAVEFLGEFAQAVADADSEEAGTVLGEAISDLITLGFESVGEFGSFIVKWADSQDWTAIGLSLSKHMGRFAKGLFMGLTHSIDGETGEIQFDGIKVARVIVAGLVARIPFVRNAMAARSGVFAVPIVGSILANILRLARMVTPGLGAAASAIAGGFRVAIGMAFGGSAFLNGVISVFAGLRLLFTGQFGALGSMMFAGLRSAFAAIGSAVGPILARFGTNFLINLSVIVSNIAGWIGRTAVGRLVIAFAKIAAGFVAGIIGWPALLITAAVVALLEFIRRFRNWNNGQDGQYESFGAAIVAFIVQGVEKFPFFEKIKAWFLGRVAAIKTLFSELTTDWESLGKGIVRGIIRGMELMSGDLVNTLKGLALKAWQGAKNVLGIQSPSKLFMQIGDGIMDGITVGIDRSGMSTIGSLENAAIDLAGVQFRSPSVPSGNRGSSGDTYVINVTGALDAEGVARQIERVLRDSKRRTGGVLV